MDIVEKLDELDRLIKYAEFLRDRGSPYSACSQSDLIHLLTRLKSAEAVCEATEKYLSTEGPITALRYISSMLEGLDKWRSLRDGGSK